MKLRPVIELSLVGALVYLVGFWGLELLQCLPTSANCTARGDISALFLVLGGSFVLLALLCALFFWIARRLVDTVLSSKGRFQAHAVLGISALVYCSLVAVIASYLFADPVQLSGSGFMWNFAAGSVLLAAYVGIFGTRLPR